MLFSSWGDCQRKSLSTSFRNFPRWLSFTKLSKLKKCLHSNIFGLNALLKCKIFVLKCRSQSFQISLQNSSHQNSIFSHFNSPQYFSGSSNIFLRLFLTIWTFSRCVEHVDDGREPPKVQLPHARQGDQGQGELLGWWWWNIIKILMARWPWRITTTTWYLNIARDEIVWRGLRRAWMKTAYLKRFVYLCSRICTCVFVLEEALGEPKWKEPFWNGLRRNSLWQDDQLEKRWSKILQNHGLFSRIDVKPLFKDKINIWKLSGSSRETKPARNKGDRVPQVGLFYTLKYSNHLIISCLWWTSNHCSW